MAFLGFWRDLRCVHCREWPSGLARPLQLFGGMSGVVFAYLGYVMVWDWFRPALKIGLAKGVYIDDRVPCAGIFGFDRSLGARLARQWRASWRIAGRYGACVSPGDVETGFSRARTVTFDRPCTYVG